jgi:hypothetical protein
MLNLVICFPGGTGGNFIGALCSHLMFNTPMDIDAVGSAHSFTNCIRYLDDHLLDHSIESYSQELTFINKMKEFNLALAHFRNLAALSKKNKKIIYITFKEENIPILLKRLNSKIDNTVIPKKYALMAGADWPSYEDYLSGVEIPELKELRNQFINDWYYIMPAVKKNVCEITFDELNNGYEIVDKLVNFLNIKEYNKQEICVILDTYRKINS